MPLNTKGALFIVFYNTIVYNNKLKLDIEDTQNSRFQNKQNKDKMLFIASNTYSLMSRL